MSIGRRSVYFNQKTQVFLDPIVDTTYIENGIETAHEGKFKLYWWFESNYTASYYAIRLRNTINNGESWGSWYVYGQNGTFTPYISYDKVIDLSIGSTNCTVDLYVTITTKSGTYNSKHIYLCVDSEGNVYNTMNYNGVLWTLENYRAKKYNDGTDMTLGTTSSYNSPYYYEYPNPSDTTKSLVSEHPLFGRLYNYPQVIANNFAVTGWRVPSYTDFTNLREYIGSKNAGEWAGTRLIKRVTNTEEYNSIYAWRISSVNNAPGNYNDANRGKTLFGAIGSGNYYVGYYEEFCVCSYIWSSTQEGQYAYFNLIVNDLYSISNTYGSKDHGFSVRLCRDISSLSY